MFQETAAFEGFLQPAILARCKGSFIQGIFIWLQHVNVSQARHSSLRTFLPDLWTNNDKQPKRSEEALHRVFLGFNLGQSEN